MAAVIMGTARVKKQGKTQGEKTTEGEREEGNFAG
ncbi:hypothetical protein VIBNISFn118_1360013 [Vibrio nigripulchritudo SFn118]|nr:hypothetical protein VIBNISFn118_1360013 [Vibrio nigripulchritudo SFn118]